MLPHPPGFQSAPMTMDAPVHLPAQTPCRQRFPPAQMPPASAESLPTQTPADSEGLPDEPTLPPITQSAMCAVTPTLKANEGC